ncbi:nucleotidyltransferase family protein [Marinobacterium rhizophilum]|uniref:nucleotidyltransferase family protein n=1 Tax=Marinobacterium rhizophilum TaxID=420402 RepID=UPI00146D50D4
MAILYGSRAKGNFKPGSDVDLTLEGAELSVQVLNEVAWALDDLLLPYQIDLSILEQIYNQDLIDHINREGVRLYTRPR